jgi:hypothetical protein
MKRIIWFVFFLIMAVACLDEPDCFRQNINLVGISFKKMYDGKGDTVNIWKVSADGFDSLFYDTVAVTNLSLPLNYLKNQTAFTIEGVGRTYNLFLNHKSKTQFVSEDCGSRFIVSDLEIISENFDSIRLVSNSLANPAHVNINVYRCPITNIMRFSFRQLFMDTVKNGREDVRTINSVTADYAPATPLYVDTELGSLLLPLNPTTDASTFNFDLDDNEAKKFTVTYQKDAKTIFEQCQEQLLFSKLDTVDNDFSILKVTVDSIHDPPYTNIVSYRCPETNMIRLLFKQKKGSSKLTDTLNLASLTADFIADPIYTTSKVTSVELPLNPDATTAQYTFNLAGGGTNTLTLSYTATPTTFHTICGQQIVFTNIKVSNSDFVVSSPIEITDPKAKFPTVNNIEILR